MSFILKNFSGATAIDKTGTSLPQQTLNLCLNTDAVLFGAVGDPHDNNPVLHCVLLKVY
jgi:isocitrate/isopropylmalate dehydrogenase